MTAIEPELARLADFFEQEGRLATEHPLLDDNGDTLAKNYLITQSDEKFNGAGVVINHTAVELFSFTRVGGITVDDMPLYPDATETQRNANAFISLDTGLMPDGTDAYLIS